MKLKGKVYQVGNNIDTDAIIPARRMNVSDPHKLAKFCFEDYDKKFHQKIKKGDIIVAGKNFGCGSSREHAPIAIKYSNISCVIAKSFARIFYRNAINIGLPILECPQAVEQIKVGDQLEVDLTKGTIKNLNSSKVYQTKPFPQFIMKVIKAGGLMKLLREVK